MSTNRTDETVESIADCLGDDASVIRFALCNEDTEIATNMERAAELLHECLPYLKEGETPVQRIQRETRDYATVVLQNIRLREALKRFREYGGYSDPVAAAVMAWFDAGMVGELPELKP